MYRNDKPLIPSFIKRNLIFGTRLRMMSVGGALCHENTIQFIQDSYKIPVYQGYGMTECLMISLNSVEDNQINSAGKIFNGIQYKYNSDGSFMVKGDNVMLGYFRQITEEGLEIEKPKDGWFNTNDNINLINDYVYVKGRINRLYKLSNGLYVNPEYLESLLLTSPIFEQVLIFGEGKPYNIVIIYANNTSECIVKKEMESILYKNNVQSYEIPKKIILLKKPFDGTLLTQKLELNRSLIIQMYDN